jgi:putative transposase
MSAHGSYTEIRTVPRTIDLWRADYNTERFHTSLGGLTPAAFADRSRLDHNPIGLCL